MTPVPQDTTPHAWEETLRYWQVLHDVVNSEPAVEDYREGKAALRSMFELKNKTSERAVDLYFGPKALIDHEGEWIKTIPGKGWFVYFRIYGPEQAAFDGSWKPGDYEQVGNLRVQS
jgi:hypothetical protein